MKKKIMALFLAVLLVIGLLPVTTMADVFTYYKWDDSQKKLVEADTGAETVTVITSPEQASDISAGWYYVNETVTIDDLVELNGTANIILGTGANITFNGGISDEGNAHTLNIYGVNANGTGGTLVAKGADGDDSTSDGCSGISVEALNVHGGNVIATGGKGKDESGDGGDGIGIADGSPLYVYGGTVTATGGAGGKCNTPGGESGDGGTGIFGTLYSYGGKIVAIGGKGFTETGSDKYESAIYTGAIPVLGESAVEMDGTNPIPEGFVIKTDTNADGSAKAVWTPSGDPLNDGSNVYVEIIFGEDEEEEDDTPDKVRRSSTTVVIGDRDDKEETEETSEENPDTGAPVMNLGAVAVVLGAAYVISKKH